MPLVPLRDGREFAGADQDVLAAAKKAYGQVLNA
jgi:hypothetical protein